MMTEGLVTVSYIGATILFILALGGLSNPETARRGNSFGGLLVGGSIGLILAKRVQMTQMPELVAILHSLVGLAAVLVGFANFLGHGAATITSAEKAVHDIETYLGILIGAVTFSGSVIAFGKLSAKISGKPLTLPGRHLFNLALLVATIWFGW